MSYSTALLAVPWASHSSQVMPLASLSASCPTDVQVSMAKRANAGYILSVCWTFIYFLTLQQETALLCSSPPMTGCLLLLGVIICSTPAFLFPSTVTEKGEQSYVEVSL